jgi:hyperosmotically inducible protein
MSCLRWLTTAALAGVVLAGPACTDKAVDETKKDARAALDATKAGADKAIEATKKAGDKTASVAKEVASATGAAVTDGWITTKVKAKITDETVLNGSDITVETDDHVVTLKGAVRSRPMKDRALEIARGTEGVARVVDQLVVQ